MIVNTRPSILANKTNELLARSGIEFMHEPLTKILSISPSNQALEKLQQLDSYDVIIFPSPTSSKFGAPSFLRHSSSPFNLLLIALGLSTLLFFFPPCLVSVFPLGFNSAGLAGLIEQGKHEKCLIFCGGKQPQLSFHTPVTLDMFSCYTVIDEESIELSNITGNQKAIFLIYNIQTLEVLVRYSQPTDLKKMNLIVASPRIQEAAFNHGIKGCVVAASPHDEEMTEAAIKLARS